MEDPPRSVALGQQGLVVGGAVVVIPAAFEHDKDDVQQSGS